MKLQLALLAAGVLCVGAAFAQNKGGVDPKAAEALAEKSGCMACHKVDRKVVGPAYKDVAAKYRTDKDALATLSEKVKKGGAGVWGQVAMPPNPQVNDAEIKTLVSWVLSLK